jgi:hypothetical protein
MNKVMMLFLAGAACAGCGGGTTKTGPADMAGLPAMQDMTMTGTQDMTMTAAAQDMAMAPPDLAMAGPVDCASAAAGTKCGDAKHCAGGACVGDETVLVVGISKDVPYGTSYSGGAWATAVQLGASAHSQGGGGVVATLDGHHGVAVLKTSDTDATLNFATWSGTWGILAAQGGTASTASIPIATTDGAFIAEQQDVDPFMMQFGQWANSGASWSAADATGQAGQNLGIPAVVATATGDPMVLFVDKTTQQYAWTLRTGGTWSASAALSTATTPTAGASFPSIAACRAGADQLLAVMVSGATGQTLLSSTFSAGAWSTPITLASDYAPDLTDGAMFALTALPDGHAAVVYVNGGNGVKVGLYDGTAWGTLKDVPGVSAYTYATTAVALARGANASAVVELAYVDFLSGGIQHTRLTDASAWTWTAPAVVDARSYSVVSLAVGP